MRAVPIVVTGGIASGKSTVTALFEALGVAVCDADIVSRSLVEPGQAAFHEIVAHWGQEILDAEGKLDRSSMRQRIFRHPEDRQTLESIIHPRVRAALRNAVERAAGPYVLLAIPLFVESGDYAWVKRVLLVDVPPELQLQRLVARDGSKPEEAARMLDAQASRAQRWIVAQDVIINDGPREQITAIVARLDRFYRAMVVAESDGAAD